MPASSAPSTPFATPSATQPGQYKIVVPRLFRKVLREFGSGKPDSTMLIAGQNRLSVGTKYGAKPELFLADQLRNLIAEIDKELSGLTVSQATVHLSCCRSWAVVRRKVLIEQLRAREVKRRGVVAIETALIMPVFMAVLLGGFELTWRLSAHSKAVHVAQTVAVLVASGALTDEEVLVKVDDLADACEAEVFLTLDEVAVSVPARLFSDFTAIYRQPIVRQSI